MNPAESSDDPRRLRSPLYDAVAHGQWASPEASRPETWDFHRVQPPTPRCSKTVRTSVNPRLLTAFPRRRYGRLTQIKYYEADTGSLVLQPAVLHLSFKVTWASPSRD